MQKYKISSLIQAHKSETSDMDKLKTIYGHDGLLSIDTISDDGEFVEMALNYEMTSEELFRTMTPYESWQATESNDHIASAMVEKISEAKNTITELHNILSCEMLYSGEAWTGFDDHPNVSPAVEGIFSERFDLASLKDNLSPNGQPTSYNVLAGLMNPSPRYEKYSADHPLTIPTEAPVSFLPLRNTALGEAYALLVGDDNLGNKQIPADVVILTIDEHSIVVDYRGEDLTIDELKANREKVNVAQLNLSEKEREVMGYTMKSVPMKIVSSDEHIAKLSQSITEPSLITNTQPQVEACRRLLSCFAREVFDEAIKGSPTKEHYKEVLKGIGRSIKEEADYEETNKDKLRITRPQP